MTARWHAALGYALTGQELDLPDAGRPNPDELVNDLAAEGWTAERIESHARSLVTAEVAWPQQVPAELRTGCGAAQFAAALRVARELLNLANLELRSPSGRRRLNPDEERLMREVPPHHGS